MKITGQIENLDNHRKFNKIKDLIHEFLRSKHYTQVDVPVLSPVLIPESYLDIFETEFQYLSHRQKMYLIPSPELFLKRLIVAGIGSCYSLTKAFRNSEPDSSRHSPEFTILEFYKVDADYMELAEDVLALFRYIAHEMFGKETIQYNGKTIHLDSWEKITVSEAFKTYAQMDSILDHDSFFKQAAQKKYEVKGFSYADVWSQIYAQEVEPHLGKNGRPTIIYEYPKELGAIIKFNKEKNVAERFEVYIEGIELGNCGNEGIDWKEYEKKFYEEDRLRKESGKIVHPPDTGFLDVLKKLPRCTGIAIGVERLAMIFTDTKSIDDLHVINF